MTRHLALVGFMASGKSTIGRKLARRLGRPFVDTDELVVREHGPIGEIFAQEGEAAFRRYESRAIGEVLANPQASVVALGGGALTIAENCRWLKQRAKCVFIKVAPEQVLARVRRSREIRPMLGEAPTLKQVKELYAQRLSQYAGADLVIEVKRQSDREVVDAIVGWMGET